MTDANERKLLSMLNSKNTFNVSKENLIRVITLFMLLLAGINVKNMNFYFLLFAVAAFLVINQRYVFDFNFLILMQLSLAWIIFSPEKDAGITSIIKPMLYPMAYLVGRSFFASKNKNTSLEGKESWLKASVFIVALGPYIHYMLNFVTNIDYESRNTIDFWTGTELSATGQAAMAFCMMAVSISLLFIRTKMYVKVFSGAAIISILLYNLVLSGRTMFLIVGVSVVVCLLYTGRQTKDFSKKIRITITVLAVIFLLLFLINQNVFGLRELLEDSNLYNRFTVGDKGKYDDNRFGRKIQHLQNFESAIFGGSKTRASGVGYAHDLYLDTLDEAGIFALFAVIEFTISMIAGAIKLIKNKTLQLPTRTIVLVLYVAGITTFAMEPILQGMPWFFVLFCFIHGMVVQVDKSSKIENI